MYYVLCRSLSVASFVYGTYATFKVLKTEHLRLRINKKELETIGEDGSIGENTQATDVSQDETSEESSSKMKFLLEYWVVLSLIYVYELYGEMFLSWIPFYYSIKCIIQSWIIIPQLKGSNIVFEHFVEPYFNFIRKQIDQVLEPIVKKAAAKLIHNAQLFIISSLATVATDQELAQLKANLQKLLSKLDTESSTRLGECPEVTTAQPQTEVEDTIDTDNTIGEPNNTATVARKSITSFVANGVSSMFWSSTTSDETIKETEGENTKQNNIPDDEDFDSYLMKRYEATKAKLAAQSSTDSHNTQEIANSRIADNSIVQQQDDVRYDNSTQNNPLGVVEQPVETSAASCEVIAPETMSPTVQPSVSTDARKRRPDSLNSLDFEELFGDDDELNAMGNEPITPQHFEMLREAAAKVALATSNPITPVAETSVNAPTQQSNEQTESTYSVPGLNYLFRSFFPEEKRVPEETGNETVEGGVTDAVEGITNNIVEEATNNVMHDGIGEETSSRVPRKLPPLPTKAEPKLIQVAEKPIVVSLLSDDDEDYFTEDDSSEEESAPLVQHRSPYNTRSKNLENNNRHSLPPVQLSNQPRKRTTSQTTKANKQPWR